MRRTFWMAMTCALAIGFAAAMAGCGSGSVNGNYTYTTTSTASTVRRGAHRTSADTNFGTWTFLDGTLSATIVRQNAGVAQFTVSATATCEAPSADFGFQVCKIKENGSCTAGAIACPTDAAPKKDDAFFLKTVDGVALFALMGKHLHVGIVQGSCDTNIAGDYAFAHLGVGSNDLFGMYKLVPGFTSVTHADFGLRATNPAANPQVREVFYTTGDPGGTFTPPSTPTCTNGVWNIPTAGPNVHATLTQSGLFLLNSGGNGDGLSFKMTNAATLADMTGRTMQGIQFPDNAAPSPLALTLGTPTATEVTANVKFGAISGTTLTVAETGTATIRKASAQTTDPLNLTAAVATGGNAYSTNDYFDTVYATAGDIPGLFYVQPATGDNAAVLLMVAKLNDKLVAFGVVSNDRGTPTIAMPNTGAFIAFEP